MLGEIHDLKHEFPELRERIAELSENDPRFAEMMAEHDEIDDRIRGLEQANQPVTDEHMEDLKRRRAMLKDRLYARLKD